MAQASVQVAAPMAAPTRTQMNHSRRRHGPWGSALGLAPAVPARASAAAAQPLPRCLPPLLRPTATDWAWASLERPALPRPAVRAAQAHPAARGWPLGTPQGPTRISCILLSCLLSPSCSRRSEWKSHRHRHGDRFILAVPPWFERLDSRRRVMYRINLQIIPFDAMQSTLQCLRFVDAVTQRTK